MITIASGLPRSGTSLMMQMLAAGGLEPLTDGKRVADSNNPRGYFEWEKAKSLPREPQCIGEAEGKVVKIISSLLLSLPNNRTYKVIFMERSLAEVAASQSAMIQKLGAQGPALTKEAMARALDAHLKQVKAALRLRPEMDIHRVQHEDILENPLNVSRTLREFLAVPLDLNAMTAQVDPSLYHQRQGHGHPGAVPVQSHASRS
jgi:hypothetical protein